MSAKPKADGLFLPGRLDPGVKRKPAYVECPL